MLLIADSGSTSTQWRMLDKKGVIKRFESVGLNPYHIEKDEIRENILAAGFQDINLQGEVEKVYFYGSGCLNETPREILKKELGKVFSKAEVVVESDLLGASRALFQYSDGIAAILGTGASSCYYDGNKIGEHIPSLGYILGDEGSGTSFGLILLKAFLNKELPPAISDSFRQKYDLGLNNVLENIYLKPFPGKYLAQFSVFLKENEEQSIIQDILYKGFQEFLDKSILKYKYCRKKKIGFVGSIAYYFRSILVDVTRKNHLEIGVILRDPMEELVKYHQKIAIK